MPTKTKTRTPQVDPTARLTEIALAIKAGAPAESFKKEMDILLGTEMAPRDRKKEEKWEAAYRESQERGALGE